MGGLGGNEPSYLHGHSALSRASFRQSGGKGLLSDTTLIPDKVLSIYLCDVRPASRGIASRRMGLWGPRRRNRGQHSMVATASMKGHVSHDADRFASTRVWRAATARDVRSAGTASPVPKYISSGVCP